MTYFDFLIVSRAIMTFIVSTPHHKALAKLSKKVGSIQHTTLLDVNVEIVAKHYPTLLDKTSHRFKLVLNLI